jgi:surface polysaccharide O-acyltransferase-like enzyme
MSNLDPKISLDTSAPVSRIVWIDILRVLCAFQIVGFHWLRAGAKVGAFANRDPQNFILEYRQLNYGLIEALHHLDVASSASALQRVILGGLGLAFGFGWEAVFVFVLLSGTSLSLSLAGRDMPASWVSWIGRRVKRILIPFYLISAIVAALMFVALALTRSGGSFTIQQIHQKVANNIGPDYWGIAWSQLVLLDPRARLWSPTFLAPAWWFVPAILLAYALFPIYMRLLLRVGKIRFLAIGALVSVVSYEVVLGQHLQEFNWWFVILNECFNFFLGIVLGVYLTTVRGRENIERILQSKALVLASALLFLAGNVCNLYNFTYPISSLLFTAPLTLCGGAIARWIGRGNVGRLLLKIDSYDLYLLHQPIAFPLIVVAQLVMGQNAIIGGLPIYFVTVISLTWVFSKILHRLLVIPFGGAARVIPVDSRPVG